MNHRSAVIAFSILFFPEGALAEAPADYRPVFEAIQSAVSQHNAAAFAALVSYPITVAINGTKSQISDAATFAASYDGIITGEIANAVISETWDGLFYRDQGAMFGNGQVWFAGICQDNTCATYDVRIITIQSAALSP